jgi:hypothetical protein
MGLSGVGQELAALDDDVFFDWKHLTWIMEMLFGCCCVAASDGTNTRNSECQETIK